MDMHLFHIGLPKAASTFLQHQVFPICRTKRKYVTSYNSNLPQYLDFINNLSLDYDSANNFDPVECVAENQRILMKAKGVVKTNIAETPHLVSSEGLVGAVLNPALNAEIIANFLAEVAPNSKILIVIRQQLDYATSIYKQIFQVQNNSNEINFQDIYGTHLNAKISFRSLDWYKLVMSYIRVFGRANVVVVPFEFLVENQLGFLQELKTQLKLDFSLSLVSNIPPENPNKLDPSKILRTISLNKRSPSTMLTQTLKQVRVHRRRNIRLTSLTEKDKNNFLEVISFSNQQLQTQVHFDLKKYSYF